MSVKAEKVKKSENEEFLSQSTILMANVIDLVPIHGTSGQLEVAKNIWWISRVP